jgi:hypothetical protein
MECGSEGGEVTTWAERALHDQALRAFISAEIARAGIDVHTAKLEHEHDVMVIAEQKRRIAELEAVTRSKGKK